MHISGASEFATDAAKAFIAERIQLWEAHPGRSVGEGGLAEFVIEQRMVGMILGKGGDTLRQMMRTTNTNIKLDQSRKDTEGIVVVKIQGAPDAVEDAKKEIEQEDSDSDMEA